MRRSDELLVPTGELPDQGGEELLGRLASKQVRLGVATLALGLGTYLAVKHAVPSMEKRGGGVVLLISSGAGVRGGSSSVSYASSKGGVHGLSLVLAGQLSSKNIRVHAICPGSIETPLKLQNVRQSAKASGRSYEDLKAGLGDPMGVGRVLAFLVSDDAGYVRGTISTR